MRLLWITGRRIGSDLAARTEIELAKGIISLGVSLTVICPGEEGVVSKALPRNTNLVTVEQSTIPGMKTISAGLRIASKIRSLNTEYDYCIIDWRLVNFCEKDLERIGLKWAIIDRGPPAFPGILPKIQKILWRRNWNIANKKSDLGFVVSEEHAKLVRRKTDYSRDLIFLNAGVPKSWLESATVKEPINEIIFCYSGALDRKRGIDGLISLSEKMEHLPIPGRIIVIGDGDFSSELIKARKKIDNIDYFGKITQLSEVERIMDKCHVGIMPMPDIEIWRISSAIKLPEYLSKGMVIIGPDHLGNRRGNEQFYKLSKKDWISEGINEITNLYKSGNWIEVSQAAVDSAANMTWGQEAKKMVRALEKKLPNH